MDFLMCESATEENKETDEEHNFLTFILTQNGVQSQFNQNVYFSFFLGRRLLVCPHFFLRQLTARGCRRA